MITPEEAQALVERWRDAYNGGEHERMLEPLRRAIAEDARAPAYPFMLGCSLLALGRAGEAVPALVDAVRLEPAYQEAQYHLGVALQALSRHREAHVHYREALRLRLRDEALPGAPRRPGPRVLVPRTALVCVDCRNLELAISALRRSMAQCTFERALFFTNRRVEAPGIEVVVIPDIDSISAYSRFMVKDLVNLIETDFALVIQYDGYVLNGKLWEPAFLDYDYVGAPWSRPSGVGNGGFSLRSRRLLQALRDPHITDLVPEDIAICETYRQFLQDEYDIRFAPTDVASRFAFETLTPPGPTLGFHGLTHLMLTADMTDDEIASYRPPPMVTW